MGLASPILLLLIFPVIAILIFLIFRAVFLWYWKVDVIVKNQQYQISLLEKQNAILVEGFKKLDKPA